MNELSAIRYEVKKSRFFAHLYEINGPEDVADITAEICRKYRNADHVCSAVRYMDGRGVLQEDWKNDGEVGRPGMALLEILRSRQCNRHMLVVARIFGGIKLGPGNVTRAFRTAGIGVFEEYSQRE